VLESKHSLYKKVEELKRENDILKIEKELLQYQLTRATNDLVRKDLKIKEMEHGRTDKSK
jgi:regulator of replication initiation timing